MNLKAIQEDPFLKPYLKDILITEITGFSGIERTFSFYADGCPGIVFQQTDNDVFLNKNRKLSSLYLYGQAVKPIEINNRGSYRMITLLLYPHVLKCLFGIDANELKDDCLDLNLLQSVASINLSSQLLHAGSAENQVKLLTTYLTGLIQKSKLVIDDGLQFAVGQLFSSNGESLKKVREELRVSERTFERKFEQHIGISPKLFSRICRFQRSLTQLTNQHYMKLSDIAFENGYTDQSHFIREFKEFTGLSPFQFQKKKS